MSEMKVILNNETYELAFSPIMQLLGHDNHQKRKIINCIANFFSKSKECLENSLSIAIDEEEVGCKYFKVIRISDLHDLDNAIALTKGSVLYDYVLSKLNDFDFSEYHIAMEDLLSLVIDTFNKTSTESMGVELDLKDYPISSLIKSHLVFSGDEMEIYKKYILLMNLLREVNSMNPTKWLVIFDNIENYLSKKEYEIFIDLATKHSNEFDIWFIFSLKNSNYTYLNESLMAGVSICNSEVVLLPPLHVLKQFIESNYPYKKEFESEELLKVIQPILGDIGKEMNLLTLDSQVTLKILNQHFGISSKPLETPNKLALEYMHMPAKMV